MTPWIQHWSGDLTNACQKGSGLSVPAIDLTPKRSACVPEFRSTGSKKVLAFPTFYEDDVAVMRGNAPLAKQNGPHCFRSQPSIFSAFQRATSLEDFVAFRTPDSRSPCTAVAPADLRALIRSELSRMKEIKFSLVSHQMSDSVLDSMILSEVIPPDQMRQTNIFFTSRILPPRHFLLKLWKIVDNARSRFADLSAAAQPPPIKSVLKKPGEKRIASGERRVHFVFDGDPISAAPRRRKRQPKNRFVWGQNSDYETALIAEIRSEANLARKFYHDMKRRRTPK
jgi:hypothetical protein